MMKTHGYNYLSLPSRQRRHDAAYWGLMLAACVVFYLMNVFTPFKEDDMVHSLVSGEWTHMTTVADFLRSCRNKFFVVNGRFADVVAQLFCGLLGKPLFNVCNALVFGLLAHVLSLLATGRRSILALVMFFTCVGTCYPVPGETMLWLAGSCNYLWTITGSMLLQHFLLLHRRTHYGWGREALLFVAAMVAGMGNEATSLAFLAAWVLYYAFNRNLIDRVTVIVLAGYLLGVAVILLSPAVWQRAASGGVVVDASAWQLLQSRAYIVGEKMVRFLVPVAALAVGLAVAVARGWRFLKRNVWCYLLVMTLLLLLALGQNPERPYAPVVTVSLVIVIAAANVVLRRRWVRAAAVVCGFALSAYCFGRGVAAIEDYGKFNEQVVGEVHTAPAQAVLRERVYPGYSRFVMPLPMKSGTFFPNEYTWRNYFDKENVQFVSDSIFERFHSGRLLDGAVEMPFVSDRPALTGRVVAFPDQDYMILPLNLDTLPTAYQVGTAYWRDNQAALTDKEKEYRRLHALKSVSDPFGYYPLRFDGKVLMVLPLIDDNVTRMELLLDYAGDEMLHLQRQAPNPEDIKQK